MTRPTLIALLLTSVLTAADPHGDLPIGARSWSLPWRSALTSPAYAKATAHEPQFGDKALWPMLSGKERFLLQKMPTGRLLVWDIAANGWTENGKPTDTDPDENTDIVLPDADKPYRGGKGRQLWRNVTVGRNCYWQGGGDGVGRQIAGNLWLRQGGRMGGNGAVRFIGAGDAFIRNDNDQSQNQGEDDFAYLHQYVHFAKEGSVEILGHIRVLDEFGVFNGCTLILAPGARVQPGRSATPRVEKGGTMALLDGAYWGKWVNEFHRAVDLKLSGTLQGGLPERPLTRDAHVGLSFRNWKKVNFSVVPGGAAGDEKTERKKGIRDLRLVSLHAAEGSVIRSIAADPTKASLVIGWTGIEKTNTIGDPEKKDGKFATPEFAAAFNAIPRQVTVALMPGCVVDGVCFDHLHPGGLLVGEAGQQAAWKGVRWGEHNAEKDPAKLVQVAVVKGDQW